MMHKLSAIAVLMFCSALLAAPQQDVVGYWTLNLQPGFNLVSFPVLPDTPTPSAVLGDRLGEVEITTWDDRLGRHRWAKYSPNTGQWSGDLYLLNRGQAYWIRLIGAEGERRVVISGHPEIYTRWHWTRATHGWGEYAPTIGKSEPLNDLPPLSGDDFVMAWDAESDLFLLAQAGGQRNWIADRTFTAFKPDAAYITYINTRSPRPIGPPTAWSDQLSRLEEQHRPRRDDDGDREMPYLTPPWPLLVSNRDGLPVCNPDGGVCGLGFTVHVIRERTRMGPGGMVEPFAENLTSYEITPDRAPQGRFTIALTVAPTAEFISPGDRLYLLVEGPRGGMTRSNSFEVPRGETRILPDIRFPNPLSQPERQPEPPQVFTLSTPYPNPFNSRFSFDVAIPNTGELHWALYDISGRMVLEWRRSVSAGHHRVTVPAADWTAGIYLLEVEANGKRGFAKVAHVK